MSPVLRILNEALRATQMSSTSDFPVSYRKRVADEHQDIIDALIEGNAASRATACAPRAHVGALVGGRAPYGSAHPRTAA